MKKQAALQFKPKKLTLQLLPRTDALYQSICQLNFNPGIQVKFKETKTAAFVVDYLKQRWQPIIKQFNVREVRIYPKKVSFACVTHRGWGLSDINVQMASVRKEVMSYQIEQGCTNNGGGTSTGGCSLNQQDSDDVFHMEYDFVFCDDQPKLPFVVSQPTQTTLFEFAPPPPRIVNNSNSSVMVPPFSKSTTVPKYPSVTPSSQPLKIVSTNGPTSSVANNEPIGSSSINQTNSRSTNSFITSFAQVSHVLDSMRSVQNTTQLTATPNPSQLLIPSLSTAVSTVNSTTDSKKRKNQASPSKRKKSTTSNKKKKSSKEGDEQHHHLSQQTIDAFMKLEKESTPLQTVTTSHALQPTESSGLSQLFHADFSMSLPLSQSTTNQEKKRDSSAYSNLELTNFTELFGSTSTTATNSCKEQSNGVFLENSQLNLLQYESNGSSFLGPKEKSREHTNAAASSLMGGGSSLQSFASLLV